MVARFEWDSDKDRSNQRKHGVEFVEAVSVFSDENALLILDPDFLGGEERFLLIGLSARLRILVVCHCYRAADGVIRIISARKAQRAECFKYEEKLP